MDFVGRLRERRDEIEEATLARVNAVSDPSEVEDPEYALGLKEAVFAALDYAFAALDSGQGAQTPVPPQLPAQARAAARNGVSLDTVLRRYSAGYTLLGDYLIGESGEDGVSREGLKRILRAQAAIYDHLVEVVSEEHTREVERRVGSTAQRRIESVRRLLGGEPVDSSELRYELSSWHVATLFSGPGAAVAGKEFADALDRQSLIVHTEDVVWLWLGGRAKLPAEDLLELADRSLPAEVLLAVGEPGHGVEGWRLTHRQARAAMSVAQRGLERRVRYADVALLASALRDDLLASSLRDIYVTPLSRGERDGGLALRETLRAYHAAGRNVSSAAAALGIARQTVSIRLRTAEERIGRRLESCAAETEVALRLDELGSSHAATDS